jgi:hypothetical protein
MPAGETRTTDPNFVPSLAPWIVRMGKAMRLLRGHPVVSPSISPPV